MGIVASGDNKHNKNGSCIDDDDGGFGDDGKAHDDDVGEVGSGDLEEGRMQTMVHSPCQHQYQFLWQHQFHCHKQEHGDSHHFIVTNTRI